MGSVLEGAANPASCIYSYVHASGFGDDTGVRITLSLRFKLLQ